MSVFAALGDAPRTFFFQHESGLRACLVVDSTRLGPAAGGIRTASYATERAAVEDARRLASAMSRKCALAGLEAGGAKTVVLADSLVDREAAFEALGAFIEELGGLYRCAGDYGTTQADLDAIARRTSYVHTNTDALAASVARGALACMRACAEQLGQELDELSVAVQGCGAIGAALATALLDEGCSVLVSDLDAQRVEAMVRRGAHAIDAGAYFETRVDVLAPCARGGVIGEGVARTTRARAICGAANNVLAGAAGSVLAQREIAYVPDVIASAGAVVDGIGETVMGLEDRSTLIDGLGDTARRVLELSRAQGRDADRVAEELAQSRLERRSV